MRLLGIVGAVVLAVAGCSTGVPVGDLVAGMAYRADPPAGASDHPPLIPGTQVVLRFEGGVLSASAGCNQMGGAVQFADDTLVLPDGLARTARACDPEILAQELWVADLLGSRPSVVLEDEGERLVLAAERGTLVLAPLPDAPLAGTLWHLAAIGGAGPDEPLASPEGASTLQVVTASSGDVFEVWTDCPGGGALGASGPVTVTDTELRFGLADPRDDGCLDPDAPLMAEVMGLLVGTVTQSMVGDLMVLTSDGVVLHYTAQP
jgi:heat shock protein HslJ